MASSLGTCLFAGTTPVVYVLSDPSQNGFLVVGNTPSATAGFGIGCLLVDNIAGVLYINTGTAATATWTRVGTQ